MSTTDPAKPAAPTAPIIPDYESRTKPYTASTPAIHLWASTGIAGYFMWKEFSLIQPIFGITFGMDPRMVGWAIATPRLFDAITDPLYGHISDNLKSPWGRRRPFMIASSVLGALLMIAMYWVSPHWPPAVQFIYLVASATLFHEAWGSYQLARDALSYELSDDYSARSRIMAIGAVWGSLPALIGSFTLLIIYHLAKGKAMSFIIPFTDVTLFSLEFPNVGGEVAAARIVALVCGILILVFGVVPTLFIRERFQACNLKPVGLWTAFLATLRNRTFLVVIALRIAETLGSSLYSSLSFFIGAYYLCQGDKAQFTTFNNVLLGFLGVFLNFLIWPIAEPLTRKLGKRRGLILGMGANLVWAVTLPLVMRPGWIWIWFAHISLLLPLIYVKGMFISAIMPDICDIDELESGERREGLYAAVLSFISKLEVSLCGLLGGYMLYWAGFDAQAASKDILPSTQVMHNLLWWGFTPLIFFTTIAFIISCFLPLTPQVMAEVRVKLEARRAAKLPDAA